MIEYDATRPLWKYKMWRRWHNLWCDECRPCYTFWTVRAIPLAEQKEKR